MLHRVYIQPIYVSHNADGSHPDIFVEVFPNARALDLFVTRFREKPEDIVETYADENGVPPAVVWLGVSTTNAMEDDWED